MADLYLNKKREKELKQLFNKNPKNDYTCGKKNIMNRFLGFLLFHRGERENKFCKHD